MKPGYVKRFSRTERTLHWVNALGFFVLLGSGLILYLPSLAAQIGRRPLIKDVHFWSGLGWIAALLLVVVLGDRRGIVRTAREIDRFDRDDFRWLRGKPAPQGRFNAGQKINTALTAAFALLFLGSGLLLWLGERDTSYRFASTVLLHDGLMYVSLALLVGHLYLAVLHPATRHALRGITVGTVKEEWATEHHSRWLVGDAGASGDGSGQARARHRAPARPDALTSTGTRHRAAPEPPAGSAGLADQPSQWKPQ